MEEQLMKTLLWIGLALWLLPALAMAQSDFDGTWRVDPAKAVFPSKPEVFLLQKGIYQCKTCSPRLT
jgi:hypothetical protein